MAENKFPWKTLRVNLSSRTWSIEEPDEVWLRTYLGGRAFGAYHLLREVPAGADPLGGENKIIIACGVLTYTKLSGASRYSVMAKSPLTGGFGEAEAGGWWGPELVSAGFNAIILEGLASAPVYLLIKDGALQILDAAPIWGKGNKDTHDWLLATHGKMRSLQIGPAGEQQVRYATLVNEIRHVHGRCGLGAVMGSKKVKAIVCQGSSEKYIANPSAFEVLREWHNKYLLESFYGKFFREHGTPSGFEYQNVMGSLPTRNFNQDTFEKAAEIGSKKLEDDHIRGHATCYGCVLRCKPVCHMNGDPTVDPALGGPEYETMAALGSCCGITDMPTVVKANALATDLGLDSISLGGTIAFAMECFEKGLLKASDCDGLELCFGNSATLLELIPKIARREGIGNLLAEGSLRAAQHIGGDALKLAQHVKGQELPMHDPRTKMTQALAFSVNPAGADHNTSGFDDMYSKKGLFLATAAPLGILSPVDETSLGLEKVRLYTYLSTERSLYNCLLLCIFVGTPTTTLTLNKLAEITQAVTGWDISTWELMKIGERALTLARLFNLKHGITARDDRLPERMFTAIGSGPKVGRVVNKKELEDAKKTYYGMMGWDENGIPTLAKLAELGIHQFQGNQGESGKQ